MDHDILLPVIDKSVLIFDVDVVRKLRGLGILGNLIGTLSVAPQQNNFMGLPLKLSNYEIVWLVDKKNAKLIKHTGIEKLNNHDPPYYTTARTNIAKESSEVDVELFKLMINPSSYSIYCQLKEMGYYILPGLKFGGQFLAYPGDPLRFHSHLIIDPVPSINFHSLIVSGRLATGVKKLYVISEPDEESKTGNTCFSIEWAGFG